MPVTQTQTCHDEHVFTIPCELKPLHTFQTTIKNKSGNTRPTKQNLSIGSNHDLSKPLPTPKIKTKKRSFGTQTLKEKTQKNDKQECPICLKNIKEKDFVVTKCGHKFCSKCIFTNFSKSQNGNNCPLCRTKFAPSFCKTSKYTTLQIADNADSVMDKFWRADKKFQSRPGTTRRNQLIETNYENYIQEHGYDNIPYLKLLDYMREVLFNCRDNHNKFNQLHSLMDDFIVNSFSEKLAEQIKILT